MWIRNLVRKKSVLQQFHEIFQKNSKLVWYARNLNFVTLGVAAGSASSRAAKISLNDSWSLYWETSKDTTQVLTHPQSRMSCTFTNHRKSCKIHLVSKTKACTYTIAQLCTTEQAFLHELPWHHATNVMSIFLTNGQMICPSVCKTYTWDKYQWSR